LDRDDDKDQDGTGLVPFFGGRRKESVVSFLNPLTGDLLETEPVGVEPELNEPAFLGFKDDG
jgi:hypothetical protein